MLKVGIVCYRVEQISTFVSHPVVKNQDKLRFCHSVKNQYKLDCIAFQKLTSFDDEESILRLSCCSSDDAGLNE